jgi:hypothetical protein
MTQNFYSERYFAPLSGAIAVVAISISLNILQPLLESAFGLTNLQLPLLVLGAIVITLSMFNFRHLSFSRQQAVYGVLLVVPSTYLLLRFSTAGESPSASWLRFVFYGVVYFILIIQIDQKAFLYFRKIFTITTVLSLASHLLSFLYVVPAYKVQSLSRVGYMYGFTFSDFQRVNFSSLNAWRFYGLANEPGAFGVLCFLMFMANGGDIKKRVNWLYLIAGLLTFSTLFLLLIGTYVIFKSSKLLVLSVLTYGAIQFLPTGSGYVWWLQYKLLPRPRDLWAELVTRWDSSLFEILHGGPIAMFFGDGTLSYLMGPPAIIILSGIIGCLCYACICVIQPRILYLPLAIIFLSRTQFPFMFILVIPLVVQGLRTSFELDSRKLHLNRQNEALSAVHAN